MYASSDDRLLGDSEEAGHVQKEGGGGGGGDAPAPASRANGVLVFLLLVSFAAIGVLAWELHRRSERSGKAPAPAPGPPPPLFDPAIGPMLSAMRNRSVDPCADFYSYACGSWLANITIPTGQRCISTTVCGALTVQNNNAILRQIAEEDWPLVGPYYQACMNTLQVDSLGTAPLAAAMAQVSAASSVAELMSAVGALSYTGMGAFFDMSVQPDAKNSSLNLLDLGQGGLALPSQALYLPDPSDPSGRQLLQQYAAHVANMLQLYFPALNRSAAEAQAASILAIETAIANVTLPLSQIRDPYQVYNIYSLANLSSLAPALQWDAYLGGLGVDPSAPAVARVNVDVPSFLAGVSAVVAQTPLPALVQYVQWLLLHASAPYLTSAISMENFNFFGKVLQGEDAPEPRWQFCIESLDADLPDALDRYFVERAFGGDSKNYSEAIITAIKAAFLANLPHVSWMDDATRAQAAIKLSQIVDLVGYPGNWSDYSALAMSSAQFFANSQAAKRYLFNRTVVSQLFVPANRGIWQMTPSTDNAFYSPNFNTINFPAGIIQPILFKNDYPSAVNFGGLGATVGHELTHAFDDQGSQYDGQGNLRSWWTPAVRAAFDERAACFAQQYSTLFQVNGTHVDGNQTLGENIADNGGIKEAYIAFKAWESAHGAEPQVVPDLTNDQLFFLSYAQGWCTLMTPAAAQQQLLNDVHAPAFARVNGPLMNYDEFARAFQCPLGSPMNPTQRCVLW
jgi:endothelin-converting enzyme/putative endopeptidase